MKGTLFGIGIGPGDPELLTLKAVRIISEASVVAYPAPEIGDSLARRIASTFIPKNVEEIIIRTPMTLNRFPENDVYDHYAHEIRKHLNAGLDVAVLCEGDPFFYGSFSYLFKRLSIDCSITVIPGVSSIGACTAAAQIPLVLKNELLTVIPATLEIDQLRKALLVSGSKVIMKIGRHLEKVRKILKSLNLEESAFYIEHASMPNEKIFPVRNTSGIKAPYFSMIVICK